MDSKSLNSSFLPTYLHTIPKYYLPIYLPRKLITDELIVFSFCAPHKAPASWIIDFAAQQYGMQSTPNMKQINDRNLSFFSPQPYFVAGIFFPQQVLQLFWLYRLSKLDSKKPAEREELDLMGEVEVELSRVRR